jgi:cobalt-zinc-cadmium efflux system outer membrane protein
MAVVVIATTLIAGCAIEDLRPDYEGARDLIATSTGRADVYDPEATPLSQSEIDAFLRDGLSLDEALRLALLNSRRLQAGFMGLGIGRAEYVQAGLLENPTLGIGLMFPSGGGRSRLNGSLAQNVMDLWRIPNRRRVAAAGMERQLLELGRQAGELVVDTKTAYYESVAARASRLAIEAGANVAHRSADAVIVRVSKGVATQTDAGLALNLALGADLKVRQGGRAEVVAIRRLASLLSLNTDLFDVPLTDALPVLARGTVEPEVLVEHAFESRLDLRAVAAAITVAEEQLALEHKNAMPDVSVGLESERPEGGGRSLIGPGVGVELPIFDRNEAQISRAGFELEQLRRLGEAMAAEVGQQVRAAIDRLRLAVDASSFVEDEVLPQAERGMALAHRAYELGATTVLSLLEAETAVLTARSTIIDVRLEAALAMVDLERALGGPLPDGDARP